VDPDCIRRRSAATLQLAKWNKVFEETAILAWRSTEPELPAPPRRLARCAIPSRTPRAF
jgi:hypothetical protein